MEQVGGIKEKVLAAHRAGVTRVILPKRNEKDLHEVPADVKVRFVTVWLYSLPVLYIVVMWCELFCEMKSVGMKELTEHLLEYILSLNVFLTEHSH